MQKVFVLVFSLACLLLVSEQLVHHFVSFRFKDSIGIATRNETIARFRAMKDDCRDPFGDKYIVNLYNGKGISTEKLDQNMTQGYVVQFNSPDDMMYYVYKDPVHDAFKKFVGPLLDGVFVYDFDDTN